MDENSADHHGGQGTLDFSASACRNGHGNEASEAAGQWSEPAVAGWRRARIASSDQHHLSCGCTEIIARPSAPATQEGDEADSRRDDIGISQSQSRRMPRSKRMGCSESRQTILDVANIANSSAENQRQPAPTICQALAWPTELSKVRQLVRWPVENLDLGGPC